MVSVPGRRGFETGKIKPLRDRTTMAPPHQHRQKKKERGKQVLPASGGVPITVQQALAHAFVAYEDGDLPAAEKYCQTILAVEADCFDALNLLGIIAAQTQRSKEALGLLERAVALNPADAGCHSNMGSLLFGLGRFADALACYSRALRLVPGFAGFHFNHGNALRELRRFDEALASYERAVQLEPTYAEAHLNRGIALRELKRLQDALDSFECAADFRPGYPEAAYNRGVTLADLKRFDAALDSFDLALRLRPDYAEAHNNRGARLLHDLKRYADALASFDRALHLKPDYAEAHNNHGIALKEMGRLDDALLSFGRALDLRPDYADALTNRGATFHDLRRFDLALHCYEQALQNEPNCADAHVARGATLHCLNRLDEALQCYERATQIQPDNADAHWNLSLCRLLLGDFDQGWAGYEWRWETDFRSGSRHDFAEPQWLGDVPVRGKTILLYCEQGLGDTIQFCRYASLVAGLGARVVLLVQPPVKSLMVNLQGLALVVTQGEALPPFDYHCPLLSLPLAFKTRLDTVPAPHRYLYLEDSVRDRWRHRLGDPSRLRIGLAWSGNPNHKNDHNRSIPLDLLLTFLPAQYQYVSLQKEVRDADSKTLAARPDILHFGEALHNFADTAALCDLMDLIISVDTSVAHLAGGLGKPLWLLLPWVPDWRWLKDREDSPWYPTARLYRQTQLGDWRSALGRVETDLHLPGGPAGVHPGWVDQARP
ncbi:MAG: tetratricopeptide repeat protein [Betaproteobacteria bacterium]